MTHSSGSDRPLSAPGVGDAPIGPDLTLSGPPERRLGALPNSGRFPATRPSRSPNRCDLDTLRDLKPKPVLRHQRPVPSFETAHQRLGGQRVPSAAPSPTLARRAQPMTPFSVANAFSARWLPKPSTLSSTNKIVNLLELRLTPTTGSDGSRSDFANLSHT